MMIWQVIVPGVSLLRQAGRYLLITFRVTEIPDITQGPDLFSVAVSISQPQELQ